MSDNHDHAGERDASETFAERLRRLRDAAGMTQRQLSDAAGIDHSGLLKTERGRSRPTWKTIVALSGPLGVSPRYLQRGSDTDTPHPLDRCMRGTAPALRSDGSLEIPLTRGQVALVDAADYLLVRDVLWSALYDDALDSYYAIGMTPGGASARRNLVMHRVILSASDGELVDHESHDTLDNRRSNIRIASKGDNMHNRRRKRNSAAPYKGITRRCHRWEAAIRFNGSQRYLGTFATPEAAAIAYDHAAREHFGEFALTNESLGLLPCAG